MFGTVEKNQGIIQVSDSGGNVIQEFHNPGQIPKDSQLINNEFVGNVTLPLGEDLLASSDDDLDSEFHMK